MRCADSSYHSGSWSFPSRCSRLKWSSSWRWGPTEWPNNRRLLQIPYHRRTLRQTAVFNQETAMLQLEGEHLRRDCPNFSSSSRGGSSTGKCYVCEHTGHFARVSPVGGAPAKKPVGDQPRALGRVFALTTTEATQSRNLVQNSYLLFGNSVVVLYDSGATHSFVSNECVRRLGLMMRELGCKLIVATPASGEVSTSFVYVGCPMEVAGRRFKVNLICLPMEGLDVILGMDWLSSNHVVIDCRQRGVVFSDAAGLELISSNQAVKEIVAGATCFMIVAQTEKKSIVEQIILILVVEKYVDVFPDEIPELPPRRDVDFTIDLISGAGLVSMALYRMAPVELAKLKKKIEDLLEKNFIRPSASPWGAPILTYLVKLP
ncbi:uncharacterized protein LOC114165260 [Vigna unguiculata]|uniref:uncharacterized protein LOC114165260 n=1 Tax=Vigna unguiculata TaxID=3917 RepID=UPI0010169F98|nr:uncharacterized protein LOC114165260 [Vigna unguiculata]